MLLKIRIEGKDRDEILNKYLEENNLTENDVFVNEIVTEAKLFKSKKVILDIISKTDIRIFIKEFIEKIAENINCKINTEIRDLDGAFNIMMMSDNNPILIGRDGKNLNSIQLLLHQSLSVQTGINIRVNVDASNYKDKRLKNLEREVKRISKEVLSSKIEVKLDPMNSYERRLVHTIVSEYSELETESFGEGINRFVVIRYKED